MYFQVSKHTNSQTENYYMDNMLDICDCICQNGVLYAHNFKSQFSPPFDRYNNRLTVHAHTIGKGSTVYFY